MSNSYMSNTLSSRELIISPRRICFLKFILEAYDGIGILSTNDAKSGLVEVRYPQCLHDEVTELLDALEPDVT